jgi:uncharacterized protein
MDSLTDERLEREFDVTGEAISTTKIKIDKGHHDLALKFMDTAKRYYEEAKFFRSRGDKASAWGALNYAHGWLDAGKESGILE